MTQPSMTTSETLNRAADLIEERGWAQGPGAWGEGAHLCLEGGILAAQGARWGTVNLDAFWACPAYRAVMQYLGRDDTMVYAGLGGAEPAEALWKWNDDDGRTAEQVVATLRAAAVIEAAKETAADPLVAHLVHHAADIIAAELDQTAPLADVAVTA